MGVFRVQKDATGRAQTLTTGEGQPLADVNQLGGDEGSVAHNRPALSLDDFKGLLFVPRSRKRGRVEKFSRRLLSLSSWDVPLALAGRGPPRLMCWSLHAGRLRPSNAGCSSEHRPTSWLADGSVD